VIKRQRNFYAEWRLRLGGAEALQEGKAAPAEDLLQVVWYHQRLLRDQLRTTDGRRITVLHPGFWSHEGGPDFRKAVIQFDSEKPISGDIELDLHASGWRAHGHDRNSNFKSVILHVVWESEANAHLPTLRLKDVLDAPIGELVSWMGTDAGRAFPVELQGKCCAPLRELPEERLLELLQQAAQVRFEAKAVQFAVRARQAGWEQALWEGLFRGLGYKHNTWPMLRLAELRTRIAPERGTPDPFQLQARLLGTASLLPHEVSGNSHAQRLWDFWWRERESFEDCTLPRTTWHLHGLRPANHPQRRLALAAHWLADGKLMDALEKWCAERDANGCEARLLEILQTRADPFWNWHWTLRSKKLKTSQPLLGATRVTDLAMNIILPWLWMRAVQGKNEAVREEMERRYFAWPAAEDNAVLRLARQRLLGTTSTKVLRFAAAQQGLLQIVRDFCEHSDALCANCQFPELVKNWPT
jgi:hypothetical protein